MKRKEEQCRGLVPCTPTLAARQAQQGIAGPEQSVGIRPHPSRLNERCAALTGMRSGTRGHQADARPPRERLAGSVMSEDTDSCRLVGIPELLEPALARQRFRWPPLPGNPARIVPVPEGIEPIQGFHLTRELARRSVQAGHGCSPGGPIGPFAPVGPPTVRGSAGARRWGDPPATDGNGPTASIKAQVLAVYGRQS